MKCLIENYDEIVAEQNAKREKAKADFKSALEEMGFSKNDDGMYVRSDMAIEANGGKYELAFDAEFPSVWRYHNGKRFCILSCLPDESAKEFIDTECSVFEIIMAIAKKGEVQVCVR